MASVNPSDVVAVKGGDGLESLVVEVDKLVSLPDIYYRLEETIVDPTSTMEVISNLLRSDPDLCARMLISVRVYSSCGICPSRSGNPLVDTMIRGRGRVSIGGLRDSSHRRLG